ncbi:MAG: hypothetical protein CBR30_08445 [Dictyoglomus sp. NZ13-RE01]|nr:MAG: hypothetical protein CBR30_08445 [Dictyoglomus sp. NZ13-RE01]
MKKIRWFPIVLILLLLMGGCVPKPQNNSPNIPQDPFPPNEAPGVTINPVLSWSCSDPDGDALVYDIYFGTN